MTAYSLHLCPRLPRELEREIFELAAQSDPPSVLKLMLVSWRVHDWAKPLLYRVMLLSGPLSSHLWRGADFSRYLSIPPAVLRNSIQHLCIRLVPEDVADYILSAASNVENLWVGTTLEHSRETELVAALSVKRLHCNENILSVAVGPTLPPVFSRLTHLEIFQPFDEDMLPHLALIPNLTHLAFDDGYVDAPSLLDLLETCTFLRVLIMMSITGREDLGDEAQEMNQLVRDPRFVQMSCAEYIVDWKLGALSGVDFWSRAEDFVARRRTEDVDPLRCVIEDDGVTE